jgi:site-specific DNA recombinase
VNKNRAVLYLRLSKEDADKVKRGDDSASIKNQRLLLTDYAKMHAFEVVKIYSDDDESGLYDDRPQFEQMMRDAGMGMFDIIIAKTQSRFSRNMEHIEKYLHHDLANLGIRFIGAADGTDTDKEDNKKSRQIHGLVNEWYCEDLSRNIRSSFRAKMKAGQFLGASCPYGYVKDKNDHNHLVIDAYAASVVRRIYRLYLSGYGKARIASVLSSEGILIPTLYKRLVLGENYYNAKASDTTKHWSYQTIHTILNNETYTGCLVQNRVNTISYKDKKKKKLPRDEWIIVPHTHEPVIEPELFQMVQDRQKARTRSLRTKEEAGIFSGFVYCADCGHAMSRRYARHGDKKCNGYICRTYKTHGKRFCESHGIDMEPLKEAVFCSIKEEARRILNPQDIRELKKIQAQPDDSNGCLVQLEQIQAGIERTEQFKRKTYRNYLEDVISKEDYLAYALEYEKELEQLRAQKSAMETKARSRQEEAGQADTWAEAFADYMNVPQLTRDMVLELIERIEVNRDGSIRVYYQFGQA